MGGSRACGHQHCQLDHSSTDTRDGLAPAKAKLGITNFVNKCGWQTIFLIHKLSITEKVSECLFQKGGNYRPYWPSSIDTKCSHSVEISS